MGRPRREVGGGALACPECGEHKLVVLDSRPLPDRFGVRRRRECEACKHRFTMHELPVGESVEPDPIGYLDLRPLSPSDRALIRRLYRRLKDPADGEE